MLQEFARKLIGWDSVKEDNLNLDSSVLTRYGNQQGAVKGYNPKKRGRPAHHPLLAFLGSGYVVNLWNRSGDSASGQSAVEFFKQTVAAMGKGLRIKQVLCDAGFYRQEFIEHLRSEWVQLYHSCRTGSGFTAADTGYTAVAPDSIRHRGWRVCV